MNAYEIRHTLFEQASHTLHNHWQNKWEQEMIAADRGERAPKIIDPPTLTEITDYAKRVYEFVQQKKS